MDVKKTANQLIKSVTKGKFKYRKISKGTIALRHALVGSDRVARALYEIYHDNKPLALFEVIFTESNGMIKSEFSLQVGKPDRAFFSLSNLGCKVYSDTKDLSIIRDELVSSIK